MRGRTVGQSLSILVGRIVDCFTVSTSVLLSSRWVNPGGWGNRFCNVVQMFDTISSDDSIVTRFATGLQCAKLSGPHDITESGVSMRFYKLECMGKTDYVNTKWVR
jgi:hypothetical protein